nr:MAG TPA: hypothetical protein [Caudoviricetes sp.]
MQFGDCIMKDNTERIERLKNDLSNYKEAIVGFIIDNSEVKIIVDTSTDNKTIKAKEISAIVEKYKIPSLKIKTVKLISPIC